MKLVQAAREGKNVWGRVYPSRGFPFVRVLTCNPKGSYIKVESADHPWNDEILRVTLYAPIRIQSNT